jgi:hypothetical protein
MSRKTVSLDQMTAAEVEESRRELSRWQSPDDFTAKVDALDEKIKSSELFNIPQLGFFRDAWVLASFARHKPARKVRLAGPREEWPDGQVELLGKILNVEITEADVPGRRRGDEYKTEGVLQSDGTVLDWASRSRLIPELLKQAIERKARRKYAPLPTLIVDLNVNEFGIRQAESELAVLAAKEHHSASFDGLYILRKDKLY